MLGVNRIIVQYGKYYSTYTGNIYIGVIFIPKLRVVRRDKIVQTE